MPARAKKNPLHPSALSINDLKIGRQIIIFNLNLGIDVEGTVVSRPYAKHFSWQRIVLSQHPQLVVDIRSKSTGEIRAHYLTDIGIVPYSGLWIKRSGSWSPVNFTVDYRKRHLLPAAIGFPSDFFDRLEEEIEEEEE